MQQPQIQAMFQEENICDEISLIFSNVVGFVCFQQHCSAASVVQTKQHSLKLTNKKIIQQLYSINIIIKEKFMVNEQYKYSTLCITCYQQRVSKNAMLWQIVPSTEIYLKFINKTFPNCFKALHTSSNEQRLLQSALYLTFYQQKFGRNAMFK